MEASLNPNLIWETINKVDQCMARLQELQAMVSGGKKVFSAMDLTPRSTRGYLRATNVCNQQSQRLKQTASRIYSSGNLEEKTLGEWRRKSLTAMLVGETLEEILQANQVVTGMKIHDYVEY
ncbi:putative microtubule-binding protein TANGLED [Tasmannia lanceolata]|uniref:putative microtubule-binding protein TANGLED n=1 Tax=Tasmannia lanceolata TaxID=3420 RepID=UPI0040636924